MAKKTPKGTIINIRDNTVLTLAIDRSPKSLNTWYTALRSAENVTNPTRRLLYDLYEDLMLDTHLSSVWSKRVLAIANTDIVFSDDAGNEHPQISELMDTEWFGQMLEHIINSKAYGHSLIDLQTPNLMDVDSLMYQECEIVDRRYVKPEFGLRVMQPHDNTGYAYREEPFTHVVLEAGRKRDLGLLLKAAPWVLLKRGDIEDWATFNELFGMPLRKGKYNPNMPGEKQTLTQAMEETAGKAYVIVPDGSEVEYVESKSSGNNENYERFARFCDEQISKHILGQTLTTESTDKGSHALGDIHEGIEEKIARSDRKFVQRILNSKFKAALVYAGYGDIDPYKFDFKEEEESLSTTEQLKNDIEIHTKVGNLKREYFVEKYNVEFDEAAIAEKAKQEELPPNEPPAKPKPKAKGKAVDLSEDTPPEDGWVRTILGWMKRFFLKAPNPKP
jgi:phage gp29-like protein